MSHGRIDWMASSAEQELRYECFHSNFTFRGRALGKIVVDREVKEATGRMFALGY